MLQCIQIIMGGSSISKEFIHNYNSIALLAHVCTYLGSTSSRVMACTTASFGTRMFMCAKKTKEKAKKTAQLNCRMGGSRWVMGECFGDKSYKA